jgi:hypothetical protein
MRNKLYSCYLGLVLLGGLLNLPLLHAETYANQSKTLAKSIVANFAINDPSSGTFDWNPANRDTGINGSKSASALPYTFAKVKLSNVSLHVENELLSNTSTEIEFSLNSTDGLDGNWTTCTDPTTNLDLGDGGFALWIRAAADISNILKVADIPAREAAPTYSINFETETTKEILPVNTEYSDVANFSSVTNGTAEFLPVVPGTTLYFRISATATALASYTQTLVIPARPAIPAYTIDYAAETTNEVVPATVSYSTSLDMSNAAAGSVTTQPIVPGQNLYFAIPATTSSFSSVIFTLNVPARPAKTVFTIDYFAETTIEAATTAIEYATNSDLSDAVAGTGAKIALSPGENAYNLYLRKKPTADSFASDIQLLLVKNRAFTPSYEIDFTTESTSTFISSLDEYAYTADMQDAVTGTLSAKAPVYPGHPIYIRAIATVQRFASVPQVLNAPARPAAPEYAVDFINETTDRIIPESLEWSFNSNFSEAEKGWDEKMPLTAGKNVYIRTVATPTAFKSEVRTLEVPARAVKPAFTINFSNETTKEVVSNMDEYSSEADMSAARAGAGGNMGLIPGQTLYFRKKATALNFASPVQTLVVPERPAAPVYTINYAQEKTAEAVPATTEYANNVNMFNASSGAGAQLEITPGQTLYFRKKAAASSFRSEKYTLVAPGRPETPMYSINYRNETTSEEVPATEEYAGSEDMNGARTGTDAVVAITPGQNMYIRIKSTSTGFASAAHTLYIPDRPAAPAYSIDYSLEQTNVAVPATVEYASTADMAVAAQGTGEPLKLVPGEELHFRTRAGAFSFKSGISSLTVPQRPAAPVYTINFSREKTAEHVAAADEYATVPAMTDAVHGTEAPAVVEPGVNLYFRTRATESSLASEIGNLLVPERPAFTATFSVDYINETTRETITDYLEYATSSTMMDASTGAGAVLQVTPGQSLYIRKKSTTASFASEIYTLEVVDRPEAPVHAEFNDRYDSFGWTNNHDYTSPDAYEYSLNAGSSWSLCTTNPLKVGHADLAAGSVQVRIKATETNFRSEALISEEPFTRALGLQSFSQAGLLLYPNPASDKLFINALPENVVLAVYSLDGKLVKSYHLNQGDNQLDISELKVGAYLLKLRGNKLNAQIRLLKQ